jgi:hypothetical protein
VGERRHTIPPHAWRNFQGKHGKDPGLAFSKAWKTPQRMRAVSVMPMPRKKKFGTQPATHGRMWPYLPSATPMLEKT